MTSRRWQRTSQPRTDELRSHRCIHKQLEWTAPQTGDSRHTLQTFQSTMSIKADGIDDYRCRSREHTLITTRTYGICTSTDSTTAIQQQLSAQRLADDSRSRVRFNGQAVFYQNGSWEYGELSKTYSDDEFGYDPDLLRC